MKMWVGILLVIIIFRLNFRYNNNVFRAKDEKEFIYEICLPVFTQDSLIEAEVY